ncbi:hypothetical protein SCE1572_01155 [Sorangium cellulosum So0157-2]|uniref:Uncharacterized protein n=1 Tax=Sorangium cellulosum So0157-2 TaxID=1254432 RepID=S4XN92_SORCE|nr:hypothetical protein SCE1572_01155 [Sorangium cellulosum So0157-2]
MAAYTDDTLHAVDDRLEYAITIVELDRISIAVDDAAQ